MLEKAKFHGIFIADVLGGYDVYRASLDPAIVSGAQCRSGPEISHCSLPRSWQAVGSLARLDLRSSSLVAHDRAAPET